MMRAAKEQCLLKFLYIVVGAHQVVVGRVPLDLHDLVERFLVEGGDLCASYRSVAHEVNNPLAGILIYIKLLLKKYKEKKLQAEETEKQLLKIS